MQPDIFLRSICDSSKMFFSPSFILRILSQNQRGARGSCPTEGPHAGRFPNSALISSKMRERGVGAQEGGKDRSSSATEEFRKGPCLGVSASPSSLPGNWTCHWSFQGPLGQPMRGEGCKSLVPQVALQERISSTILEQMCGHHFVMPRV